MDDIVLPPLPPLPMDTGMMSSWLDQIRRAAVIADRKRREKPEPKPTRAYQVTAYLSKGGVARLYDGGDPTEARRRIRWTDDGRVWIESDDHRGVASDLRRATVWLRSQDAHVFAAVCRRAADLLDGGESC